MQRPFSTSVRLDERVVVTLLISCVAAFGTALLAFRYSDNPVQSPQIVIKSGIHYPGELLQFTIKSYFGGAGKLSWQIEDGAQHTENGAVAFYTFTTSGTKKIRLLLNGTPVKDTFIYISPTPLIQPTPPAPATVVAFTVPSNVFAGTPVTFTDETVGAVTREWQFGETEGGADATTRNPTYTFTSRGRKRVSLVVNGRIRGEAVIFVRESVLPPNETSHPNRTPKTPALSIPGRDLLVDLTTELPLAISVSRLEEMLWQVVDGHLQASHFDSYLCSSGITTVYNGTMMSFPAMCTKLRAIKRSSKIRKMFVSREIDPTTNCVVSIRVDIDKKKWFTQFFEGN